MNGKMPREGVIFGLLAVWTTLVHILRVYKVVSRVYLVTCSKQVYNIGYFVSKDLQNSIISLRYNI